MASRNQDLTAATNTVANDPALLAAQADAAVGLFREGNWEADELLQRYPDRADRLYVLARRFADLGLAGGATRLGEAAYSAASIQTPQDAPAALLKVAFPRPFADLTDAASARYGVDQLLLEATFRDASQFDAWAENAATGARGLAQMSPVHADEIRAALGLQSNPDDEIHRPTVAVEQQAWLLADRLRRFDGRPEVALSAIATTDRLVDGWLVRPGAEDVDAFIELIDFEGVRAALRGVLATRLSYAIAYGRPGGSLTSGDPIEAVRVKPEPTAAWIKIARLAGEVPSDAPLSPAAAVGTPDQQTAFARGATLQRDGDYAAAALIFEDLASSPVPAVATAARLRLGQALIGARRPTEAVGPLQMVEAAQPPGSAATFLLGRALADAGRCQDALGSFEQFAAANPGPLAAQAQVAEANCLADLGRPADAVARLEQAAATSDVSRLQTLDFREKLALARVRAGDVEGARADYAALLSLARSSSYRAELSYYLGLLAPDASQRRGSIQVVGPARPEGRAARAALDELVALGDPFALSFEAGDTRFEQNRYREALAAYTAFLQQNPADPRARRRTTGAASRWYGLARSAPASTSWRASPSVSRTRPTPPTACSAAVASVKAWPTWTGLRGRTSASWPSLGQVHGPPTPSSDWPSCSSNRATSAWPATAGGTWPSAHRLQTPRPRRCSGWPRPCTPRATRAALGRPGRRRAMPTRMGFTACARPTCSPGETDPRAQADQTLPIVQARAGDDPMASLQAWVASRGDVSAAQQVLADDPGLARADTLLAMGLRQAGHLGAGRRREPRRPPECRRRRPARRLGAAARPVQRGAHPRLRSRRNGQCLARRVGRRRFVAWSTRYRIPSCWLRPRSSCIPIRSCFRV